MSQQPNSTFRHIGLCVSNYERSVRFYKESLDFELSHQAPVAAPFERLTEFDAIKGQAGFFTRGNTMIEILAYETPTSFGPTERRPMNQLGITHLSFVVNDLDGVVDRIVKAGGRVYPQTKVVSPMGDLIFCTDPDGIRIELWQKAPGMA